MKKKKFRLNILDITVIAAVVLIIIASIITVWRDKTKDKAEITVVLLSDEYISEVFGGIEKGSEVYNSSSGNLIGVIDYLRIVGEQSAPARIELGISAEAEEVKGGALIDGDRYYMGDRLSVNVENSRIVCLVREFGITTLQH